MENPPRRAVPGLDDNRLEAWRYVEKIRPSGQTDVIPALTRAFEVLAAVPNTRPVECFEDGEKVVRDVPVGKVIYLLTDGEFSDNVAVLQELRKLNSVGRVRVHTILHHHRSDGAMNVLRQIADEHGGKFKFVEPD